MQTIMELKFAFEMSFSVSFLKSSNSTNFSSILYLYCEILVLLGHLSFSETGKNWKEIRLIRIKLSCHTRFFLTSYPGYF